MKVKFETVEKYLLVNEPENQVCKDLRQFVEDYDVILDNVSFDSFQAKIAYIDYLENGDYTAVDFQLFDPFRTSGFDGYISQDGWTHWLNAYIDESSGLLGAVDSLDFQEISEDDIHRDEVGEYVYIGEEKLKTLIVDNDEITRFSEKWMDELAEEVNLATEEIAKVAGCTHCFCDKGTKYNDGEWKEASYTTVYYKKVTE